MINETERIISILHEVGKVFGTGFSVGIVAGTVVFLLNWLLSSVMNILKFPTKGE
jgi:hypothetical protein